MAKEGKDMIGSVFLKDKSMGACRERIMGTVGPTLWICPRQSEAPEPSTVMILLLSSRSLIVVSIPPIRIFNISILLLSLLFLTSIPISLLLNHIFSSIRSHRRVVESMGEVPGNSHPYHLRYVRLLQP